MDGEHGVGNLGSNFPIDRQCESAADCYALLLVQAGIRAHAPDSLGAKERRQEALRILDQACALGIQTRSYHLRRARILELLGETPEAQRTRELAASVPLDTALDHFLIGEQQYRRGAWEQARDSFHRAVHQQPGFFWAQFFLAVCQLGVLMNTRGLMELIVLNIGLELKVISPQLFAMMVLMALVTTIATTPLLQMLGVNARTLAE
jgi:tetratricopeptide (TPR) repeat protein